MVARGEFIGFHSIHHPKKAKNTLKNPLRILTLFGFPPNKTTVHGHVKASKLKVLFLFLKSTGLGSLYRRPRTKNNLIKFTSFHLTQAIENIFFKEKVSMKKGSSQIGCSGKFHELFSNVLKEKKQHQKT